MSWLPDWLGAAMVYGAVAIGLIVLSAVIAALVDHLFVRPRIEGLEAEVERLSQRLERFEGQVSRFIERYDSRQSEGRGSKGRSPGAVSAAAREASSYYPPLAAAASPAPQPRPAPLSAAEFAEEAAEALATQDAFREFVRRRGGRGYSLKGGAEGAETVAGGDEVLSADLWVIEERGERLVFPGWKLLRSQSSLLADAGRVARERLGWLYDVEPGGPMHARVPARISAGSWTVIQPGVLVLPL